MVNGKQYQTSLQQMARTGLWPTPNASDWQPDSPGCNPKGRLKHVVARPELWPTPTTQDAHNNGAPSQNARNTPPLNAVVTRAEFPTPTKSDAKGGALEPTKGGRRLATEHGGGKLNPTWVEWLMGWPLGWTDLKPLATAKFRQWQQQHGIY